MIQEHNAKNKSDDPISRICVGENNWLSSKGNPNTARAGRVRPMSSVETDAVASGQAASGMPITIPPLAQLVATRS